jgi:hypothetical protein
MRERRSLPSSWVLNGNAFNPATKKCVPIFEPIESVVQPRDHSFRLIRNYDQFYVDLFVAHVNSSNLNFKPEQSDEPAERECSLACEQL